MSVIKVLIADDDEMSRNTLGGLLIALGFGIKAGADGQHAIEATADFEPEIVVTDYHMPKISGVELIKRLRERNPSIEAIIITGSNLGEVEKDLNQHGLDNVTILARPYNFTELERLLTEASQRLTRAA